MLTLLPTGKAPKQWKSERTVGVDLRLTSLPTGKAPKQWKSERTAGADPRLTSLPTSPRPARPVSDAASDTEYGLSTCFERSFGGCISPFMVGLERRGQSINKRAY